MKTQTHMFPPSSFHDTSHTLPSGKSVQTPVSQQLPPQFLFQQVMGGGAGLLHIKLWSF